MKVNTPNDLYDKLDHDLSWRKKELIDYKFVVERNKNSTQLTPLIRGGIALAYAHWEGFVKTASAIYIGFISTRKIPIKEIDLNFVALSYLRSLNKDKNINECISLLEDILLNNSKPCKIYDKDVISTKSNLRLKVLEGILTSLNLEKDFFLAKENFIDKKLVEARNDIAHGAYREVSYDDYELVHKNIIPMMDYYKTLIQNSVTEFKYKRKSVPNMMYAQQVHM